MSFKTFVVLGLCSYHSCQNGGICFDFEEDFMCHCNLEYEGKSCETGNSSLWYSENL